VFDRQYSIVLRLINLYEFLMWTKYEAHKYSDRSVYSSVSQTALLADAFCHRQVPANSQTLALVHVVWADDRYLKLKIAI
jgi:hypothetical protein